MVVLPLRFGEQYRWFTFLFSFAFAWRRTVRVYGSYALVTAVCRDVRRLLAMDLGLPEQFEVMGLAWCEGSADDLFGLFVDDYLAFGSMPFLLAGVVLALSFFGRSTGDSLASTSTTSISTSLLVSAFRPGRWKRASLMSVSSTRR